VCEPGRGELDGGVVKPAPRTHQGLVSARGLGPGVFRGGMFLRAVRGVIGPRHTPYEEARFSAHACAGETRRVCESGRGELVEGAVKNLVSGGEWLEAYEEVTLCPVALLPFCLF
jgi:hypothetical protein